MTGGRQPFHGAWILLIPLAMLGWIAFGNLAEDQARSYRALKGTASAAESEALGQLMDEAYATLRSEAFQQNLRGLAGRYPAIYARRDLQDASTGQLADYVALKALGSRFVNPDVILIGGTGDYHAMAGQGPGEGRYSDIILGRFVMAHWRADDLVRRSCAINVAAHEYAHTISMTPFVYQPAFTDTQPGQFLIPHRKDRTTPVASYLIGAVAQCTWLQTKGRIGSSDVPACVAAFGVASGNDQRCGAFPGNTPVAPRPGLPPLNPNL